MVRSCSVTALPTRRGVRESSLYPEMRSPPDANNFIEMCLTFNHRSNYRTDFSSPLGDEYYVLRIIISINKYTDFNDVPFNDETLRRWKGSFLRFLLSFSSSLLNVRGEKISIAPGPVENYRTLISEALIRKDRDKRRKFLSKLSPFRHPLRDGNFYAIFRLFLFFPSPSRPAPFSTL